MYISDPPLLPYKSLTQDPAPRSYSTHPETYRAARSFCDYPAFLSLQLTKGGRRPLQVLSPTSEKRQSSNMHKGRHTGFRGAKRPSSSRRGQQQMPFWSGIQGGRLGCGGGSVLALLLRTNKHPSAQYAAPSE